MKKKALLLAVVMLLAIGLLAGCGSSSSDATADQTLVISGSADLAGLTVGVQQGTTGNILASEMENVTVEEYKKAIDAAQDLLSGRVDAVIIDSQPAQSIVAQLSGLVILDEQLSSEQYAIAVDKGQDDLLASIDSAISAMQSDGTFDTLYAVYIEQSKDASEIADIFEENEGYSDTITMGTNAEFPPFEYVGEDGSTIEGFDIAMATCIANSMEKKLVIDNMQFGSLISALNAGTIDFIAAGMTATDERRQNVDFSANYFDAYQAIIVRAENAPAK